MSDPRPEGRERASELFAEALARHERGESVDLAALAAAHPELASELEHLRANWLLLEEGLARFESSAALADAAIADAERALLKRLAARRAAPARYAIGSEVARGGMGSVLEVRDEDLVRTCAMKVADLDAAPDPRSRAARLARFLREAQITGQLEHPGIVPVHELGVDEAGRPYFTMPLVRGSDLRSIFERARAGADGWNLTRAVGVLLKVCETIAFAHARGVVHRDLKPANVMVGRYGEVHVMDWGLAKLVDAPELDEATDERAPTARAAASWTTRDGAVLGTPAYMPPEQAAGRADAVAERADVYAIGAMLYHLLAGAAPYADRPGSASAEATVAEVLAGPPTALAEADPEVPAELAAICERAMAREPRERYASAESLADDLRAWLEGRVVSAYERGAFAELRKWVRRNRVVALLLAALAVALPLIASLATYAAATRGDVLAAAEHGRLERLETLLEGGFLELSEGDIERAQACFRGALETQPASVEATAGLAIVLRHMQRPEEALRLLDELAADEDTEAALAPLRADLGRALGMDADAELAAKPEPRSALGAFLVGEHELIRGHGGEESAFERAARLFERAVERSHHARRLYTYELAHAVLHAGPSERRREVAATLLELWPGESGALYFAGHALAAADDLEAALPLLERARAMEPESVPICFGLAWALRHSGDLDAAEALLRAILADHPSVRQVRKELASLLLEGGEEPADARGRSRAAAIEEALALSRALASESPRDGAAQAQLGRALHAAGDESGANAAWDEALRLNPSEPFAHVAIGRERLDAGDLDDARAHFEAAVAADPRQARGHYNLGCVLLKQDHVEEAVEAFRSAIRCSPALAEAHCNLGHALRALGRFDEALQAMRAGNELGSARADWSYPSERWVRDIEELIQWERRLPEVLADPSSAGIVERGELASYALKRGRTADALALFESALEGRAELAADSQHRLLIYASRAAVRGASEASVRDAARSRELRALALGWLEADVLDLERWLADGVLAEDFVHDELVAIAKDPELARVREQAELAALDADEAERWRAQWETVAALREACAGERER